MKLIPVTDEKKLTELLGTNCSFERNASGNIDRIIVGDVKCPTAIIRKQGTYSDQIEVAVPETREEYKSETTMFGAAVTFTGTLEEVESWERDRVAEVPGLVFNRKLRKVLVD